MKRREVIKKVESYGFYFLRTGGNHDIYSNGKWLVPIERHREIEDFKVKEIIKQCQGFRR